MNFPDFQLTNYGMASIMAAAYSGEEIIFTEVKFGKGYLPDGVDVRKLQSLINPSYTVRVDSISVSDKVATITFKLPLSLIYNSFYLREIALYAKLGENGVSSMYAYTNAGDGAVFVAKDTSNNNVTINFTVHVAVGDAEHVTAIINGVTGYVTEETYNEHLTDYTNPHRVTKDQVGLDKVPNLEPSDMTIAFSGEALIQNIKSGETLSTIMGKVWRDLAALISHLRVNNNPHNVTPSQIHAAEEAHTHSADDIATGTLPIERGGTGVATQDDLKHLVANNPVYLGETLFTTRWSSATYNFSGIYADDKYNINISLAPTANKAEQEAFAAAMLTGSATGNVITALGDVPTINLPIILMITEVR